MNFTPSLSARCLTPAVFVVGKRPRLSRRRAVRRAKPELNFQPAASAVLCAGSENDDFLAWVCMWISISTFLFFSMYTLCGGVLMTGQVRISKYRKNFRMGRFLVHLVEKRCKKHVKTYIKLVVIGERVHKVCEECNNEIKLYESRFD